MELRSVCLPGLVAHELFVDELAAFGFSLLQDRVVAQGLGSDILVDAANHITGLGESYPDVYFGS